MLILTRDASLACVHMHRGKVKVEFSQDWVTVGGRSVLVDSDPEHRSISGCPLTTLTGQKPCQLTLNVTRGYVRFIFVSGHSLCTEDLIGKTDGHPPGTADYLVLSPGQDFVNVGTQ
jgi:hypothetical protein